MEPGYRVTTDPAEIDHHAVWQWLHDESYWAKGRPWETHERAVAGSICFGVLDPLGATAGFARVVTDRATFAWLCDVFVLPAHRGTGLGVALVEAALGHPELAGIKRWILGTADAHGLYERFGFGPLDPPERWMTRVRPDPP